MTALTERSGEARSVGCARLALILWTLAVLAVGSRIAFTSPTRQNLFPVYQNAALSWSAGRDLYRDSPFDYRYSPLFAAAVVPLSTLPVKVASILWRVIGLAAFLASLYWITRVGIPENPRMIPLIFIAVLPLSLGNLNNGQANLLVTGALLASVPLIIRERWMLAAAALTLAASVKVYPIAVCCLFALMYPRQLSWRIALCIGLAIALPFALQRTGYVARQYHDWLTYLRTEDRTARPLASWYNDLRLVLRLWSIPVSSQVYLIGQVATGAAMAVLAVIGRIQRWPARYFLPWLLFVACCWMLLFGPATESSTYVLIAPATAWVVARLFYRSSSLLEIGWVTLCYGLQLLAGLTAWFGGMKAFGVYTSPLTLSTVLLAAYLLCPTIIRGMDRLADRSASSAA